jgi:predicted RNA-binding protein
MCQSNAYFAQDGEEELILEDVISVKPEGDRIQLVSLFGEQKTINAKIKFIDLIHHKIIFEKQSA